MKSIDINCDMGEGFGAYTMGDDDAMLEVASTVNLACGFHAGDPSIMQRICTLAKARGVAVGAHPGYLDLWGFGRRATIHTLQELQQLTAYQVGAAAGVAALCGHKLTHVKAHGAMRHLVADDSEASDAFARAVAAVDRTLAMSAMAGTRLEQAAERAGLRVVREIYADRAYLEDGRLVPRNRPGAVIHDAAQAAQRVVNMISEGALITEAGKRLPTVIDTVCVHGDTANAVPMARLIRRELEKAGYAIRPYAKA